MNSVLHELTDGLGRPSYTLNSDLHEFLHAARLCRMGSRRAYRLFVAKAFEHFEHFAAGGEHVAARAIIGIEAMHQFDFGVSVIAFGMSLGHLPSPSDFGRRSSWRRSTATG